MALLRYIRNGCGCHGPKRPGVGNALLPEPLYRSLHAKVASGAFATPTDVVTADLGRRDADARTERAVTWEGIREGVEDMKAGRTRPAEKVFEEMRRILDG
jgi:hypothetical protein